MVSGPSPVVDLTKPSPPVELVEVPKPTPQEAAAVVASEVFKGGDDPTKRHVGPIPDAYARIVQTVFSIDPWADFFAIVKQLDLGDDFSREEVVRENLAHGEDRARQAHRLFVNAELELRRWRRNNETIVGAMWASATSSLQDEKVKGSRAKAITDKDVEHKVHELFPDEYRAAKDKEDQFELVVDHLKDIAKKWESRCYSLNTLAGRNRR